MGQRGLHSYRIEAFGCTDPELSFFDLQAEIQEGLPSIAE
jgi:hypothetical protein